MKKIFSLFFSVLGRGVVALVPILFLLWFIGVFWDKEAIALREILDLILKFFIPGIIVRNWMIAVVFILILFLAGLISAPVSKYFYGFLGKTIKHALKEKIKEQRHGTVVFQPFPGVFVLGIITGFLEDSGILSRGNRILKVFVPSVPTIFTGLLVFIQEKDVIYVNISTEEMIKICLSGGVLAPVKIPELKELLASKNHSPKAAD